MSVGFNFFDLVTSRVERQLNFTNGWVEYGPALNFWYKLQTIARVLLCVNFYIYWFNISKQTPLEYWRRLFNAVAKYVVPWLNQWDCLCVDRVRHYKADTTVTLPQVACYKQLGNKAWVKNFKLGERQVVCLCRLSVLIQTFCKRPNQKFVSAKHYWDDHTMVVNAFTIYIPFNTMPNTFKCIHVWHENPQKEVDHFNFH